MFDPTTAALIRAAPPLQGLDLNNLPKRLTEAFADIVSARVRLRGAPVEADDEAMLATVAKLRRIAAAHETYAALLPDRENRASARACEACRNRTCNSVRVRCCSSKAVSKRFMSFLPLFAAGLSASHANAEAAGWTMRRRKNRGVSPGLHAGRLERRIFSLALKEDGLTQIHIRSGRQGG